MIATVITLQACGCQLAEMRRVMPREAVVRYAVETVCEFGIPPCDPDCVEVRIAFDADGDGDVDLIDYAAFQREGDPARFRDFQANMEAFR